MSFQQSQVGFFSLPAEIRLCIYELALVCKKQMISLRMFFYPMTYSISANLSLLRTCKRIYSEASQILYSKNTFSISQPKIDILWLKGFSPINTKHLRHIRIFVEGRYEKRDRLSWYTVPDFLAQEARGLRHISIFWEAEGMHQGAGKDVHFVRKLGMIKGLQSMEIAGCYAVNWPGYLTEKMGLAVKEANRDEHLDYLWYQKRTEDLVP